MIFALERTDLDRISHTDPFSEYKTSRSHPMTTLIWLASIYASAILGYYIAEHVIDKTCTFAITFK
jgi:hypothetical protein